jgi:hypothetical protein
MNISIRPIGSTVVCLLALLIGISSCYASTIDELTIMYSAQTAGILEPKG